MTLDKYIKPYVEKELIKNSSEYKRTKQLAIKNANLLRTKIILN